VSREKSAGNEYSTATEEI